MPCGLRQVGSPSHQHPGSNSALEHQVLNFIMTAQEPGVVCQMLEIGVDAQIGILKSAAVVVQSDS